MKDLKDLNLTSDDFKLLADGLDVLPERGVVGEFVGDLLFSSITKDDKELKAKFEEEREHRREKQRMEKERMQENIRILQGKLFMFKRYMQENGLLS